MRVICVIGMHRSGTSALTRILNHLGVSLGPEEQLLEPAPHNPGGFWENERVFELNDELLEALGGNATTPPVLADGWERASELDGLRARAASLVASLADGAEIAGWKNPRLSLTLPFWRTVAPVAAGQRSPPSSSLSTASSIASAEAALALQALLYRLLADGGLSAARPLVELLHRSWLEGAELRRVRAAADELQRGLAERGPRSRSSPRRNAR